MANVELQLLQIFSLLNSESSNNYLVGGCVRDKLSGKIPKDFDIVTDIHMDNVQKMFENSGWAVKDTGKQFLVLSISKEHEQYEIANFRKDGVYSDGRRPEAVQIGTIQEDAMRRDFTVNALYLNPMAERQEVVDPTGKGMEDLNNGILRFIGRPEDRIKEDYLRVFRFYRFLTKGFKPDPRSLRAVREHFNEAYTKTTPERVRAELEKLV
jgi:tRNA nucleotidyltransferase/poly(A) polymerase